MKEYTIMAMLSVVVVVMLDSRFKTRILKRPLFYVFFAVIIFFKFLVNGFLTGQNIVIYNPNTFLGVRLTSIPLEDFLFGFSMVTLSIIFWERFKR